MVQVPLLKLEEWDFDHNKFPHLATKKMMCHIIDTNTKMITLEQRRWLRGVDKAGFLNLLWVLHYNRTPVTLLVIKQLLCLVYDGFLWLEELIPITSRLIHSIMQLPYIGENLTMIFGRKGGVQVLAESMK